MSVFTNRVRGQHTLQAVQDMGCGIIEYSSSNSVVMVVVGVEVVANIFII